LFFNCFTLRIILNLFNFYFPLYLNMYVHKHIYILHTTYYLLRRVRVRVMVRVSLTLSLNLTLTLTCVDEG
jgi:hypothetical protein